MRRAAVLALVCLAGLAAAAAAARRPAPPARAAAARGPQVQVLVVGRSRVLFGPRTVRAAAARVRVAGRRCAAPVATPLAALVGARRRGGPSFAVRDYGSCSARAADSASLFVYRVGRDRNRGRDGWTYKVGVRSGTTGAGDPSGPFGTGRRLRSRDRVTWFWCVLSRSGSCQRTLAAAAAPRRVPPGGAVTVTVRGYDDNGRGVPVAGAAVRLAAARATTAADGTATLRAPTRPGRVLVAATRAGMVASFPEEILVG